MCDFPEKKTCAIWPCANCRTNVNIYFLIFFYFQIFLLYTVECSISWSFLGRFLDIGQMVVRFIGTVQMNLVVIFTLAPFMGSGIRSANSTRCSNVNIFRISNGFRRIFWNCFKILLLKCWFSNWRFWRYFCTLFLLNFRIRNNRKTFFIFLDSKFEFSFISFRVLDFFRVFFWIFVFKNILNFFQAYL